MEDDWGERRSEPDPLKDGDQDDRREDEDPKESVVVGGEQSSTTPDQETLQASQTPARVLAEEDLVAGGGEEDILHHQDHNDLNDHDPTKSRGAQSTDDVIYHLPTFEVDLPGGSRSLEEQTDRQKSLETTTDDFLPRILCEEDCSDITLPKPSGGCKKTSQD